MAELKTKRNDASVEAFIESIPDEQKKADSKVLLDMMGRLSNSEPEMWGPSIIGFSNYHYVYKSGREGDWFKCGFSPRKQALTLYIMTGTKKHEEILQRLGKYKTGKSCLYIKRLDQVDMQVLEELIRSSIDYIDNKYS